MQARMLCLFYTEDMFTLKQMRKSIKKKIIAVVEKLGPEIFQDFDKLRLVKRGRTITINVSNASSAQTDSNYHH